MLPHRSWRYWVHSYQTSPPVGKWKPPVKSPVPTHPCHPNLVRIGAFTTRRPQPYHFQALTGNCLFGYSYFCTFQVKAGSLQKRKVWDTHRQLSRKMVKIDTTGKGKIVKTENLDIFLIDILVRSAIIMLLNGRVSLKGCKGGSTHLSAR